MRRAALLVVVVLLLAGCSGLVPADDAGTANETVTPTPETPQDNGTTGNQTDETDTDTDATDNGTERLVHTERPDPDSDRIGWEAGYWHDDPINIDASDGLNATERDRVVSRAMARVEQIREREFGETVNVSVISRSNYSSGGNGSRTTEFQQFDNAKFEALYLIGGETDSISKQGETRNRSVAGFYSPARGNIVIVSDAANPSFDGEGTLAHELAHALQDQQFNLSDRDVETRDAYNGRNGLIEGDARTVELAYDQRCGETWACLESENQTGGEQNGTDQSSIHLGVYILEYFPYSDGPGLIDALRTKGGWDAVDAAFESPPTSAAVVISPDRYGSFEPREVQLEDRTGEDWERVRPDGRVDHARLGQSALTAMFAYTLYDDYNRDSVVGPLEFLNLEDGEVNWTDPFNYGLPATEGWTGDRMHVYRNGSETGYVWRLTWESSADAQQFAGSYEELLEHWGGTSQGDGVWRIADDSPFTAAVDVTVEGDTVTIVNAPTVAALDGVRREG